MITEPCPHKESFPNEVTAKQVARQYQRDYGERSRPYCCDLCGWYHLTCQRNRHGQTEYTLRLRAAWAAEEAEYAV